VQAAAFQLHFYFSPGRIRLSDKPSQRWIPFSRLFWILRENTDVECAPISELNFPFPLLVFLFFFCFYQVKRTLGFVFYALHFLCVCCFSLFS